jgi:tetratricopeptide (TPR) repeat protein
MPDQLAQALAHHHAGRRAEAEALYRQILREQPDHGDALRLLATLAWETNRLHEAIELLNHALAKNPDSADIHALIGLPLVATDQLEQAIAHLQKAVALRPNFADAHANLAVAFLHAGQPARAVDAARASLALEDRATVRFNLGFALLLMGELRQGWREYFWRWRSPELNARNPHQHPQWDGSPLAGRTLLLHGEQGFGDTIQFSRFIPLIAARESKSPNPGKIVFRVQPSLKRLLMNFPGTFSVIARGEPLPPCDLQCPLLNVPMLVDTTLQSIPADTPYIHADAELSKNWQRRMAGAGQSVLKIGLCWAGRPTHPDDHHRSIRLAEMMALAQFPNIHWFSLQKGPRAAGVADEFPLTDWTADLSDFADTAALIANLDLVLTVDTSVAHLAGAMGKPTWVLLPYAPDWRWLLERSDSPWYPTARLFRQPKMGDWETVIAAVGEALVKLASP